MSGKRALEIVMDGVEELEAVAPVDCLRRAGAHVTVASAARSIEVTGRNGIRITADCSLDECLGQDFDLVVIPGGPGHKSLLEDPRVLDLLRRHNRAGRLIGSICAGPLVLQAAGVLEGRAYTSFPGTREQLPGRDPVSRVVCDENVITSQGAGTAVDFALALVRALFGERAAADIAASICH